MTIGIASLATLLPVLCFAGLADLFLRAGTKRAQALLFSAICLGIIVTIGTEVLSIFKLINYSALTAFWFLSVGTIFFAARLFPRNRPTALLQLSPSLKSFSRMQACGIIGIISITGLTAIIAPPNNFDSLTYHLARIIHWMQNQSVEHYPTNITRQLYSGPWAEYLLLNIRLLSGSDRLLNLLQWSAMLGTLLVVACIVRELGGSKVSSLYAALLCVSIPMGILQASSTQNDYVTAFWLACFVWGSLLPRERVMGLESILTGCSLGLAILTKGTAYPLAFPFLLWMLMRDMRLAPVRAISGLLLVLSLVTMINGGHYLRNMQTFGSPISTGEDSLANEAPGIRSMALNMGRNIVMQFATPFADANHLLESGVSHFAKGLGVEANDSKTTLGVFHLRPLVQLHEDFAANPLHTILMLVTVFLVLTQRGIQREPLLRGYTLTLFTTFMTFSLLLKWQPFGSRLLLPLFILWMPISAIALSRVFRDKTTDAIILIFLVCTLPWLIFNTSRPLVQVPEPIISRLAPGITPLRSILATDRIEQYYANKPEFRSPQTRVAKILVDRGCKSVGLIVGNDYWEYPLWLLMQREGNPPPRFEHLQVANCSRYSANPVIAPGCQVFSGKDNITGLAEEN